MMKAICLTIALACAGYLFAHSGALGQPFGPTYSVPQNCSGTAGTSAANISFAKTPQLYLSISNPSSSATLWVNVVGGTAAANGSGSFPIGPLGGPVWWNQPGMPPPAAVSIVASAISTPYTCAYQ
jgi:hypothetical protein